MPERIQRKRTKGWRMPAGTVYVGRGSIFGNHVKVGENSPKYAVQAFRDRVESDHKFRTDIRIKLMGKNLACWCRIGQFCHGDVLLEIANAPDLG